MFVDLQTLISAKAPQSLDGSPLQRRVPELQLHIDLHTLVVTGRVPHMAAPVPLQVTAMMSS